MNIALGADHRGAAAAERVIERLRTSGHAVEVFGGICKEACDYPEKAYVVATAVSRGEAERGLLLCGSGIGMCMAANKVAGVRAALVHDELSAEMSRRHNDANVLCLPADLLGERLIDRIVEIWLNTPFDGGRHARRVAKIMAIEKGLDPREVGEPAQAGAHESGG